MGKASILVIEDDADILELICYHLSKQGFSPKKITDGSKALLEIGAHPPDLILLDLMLPGLSGLDIMRQLKDNTETKQIPVIMVTAKGNEEDIVKGLEFGADDYIPKPFSPRVLVARVKAVLRRKTVQMKTSGAQAQPVHIGPLSIDPQRHHAEMDGRPLDLTRAEFTILTHLAEHPGWVFTRSQIVEATSGDAYHVTDRSVDVLVFGLRKKLGKSGGIIETVRGIGYRFKETGQPGKRDRL